MQNRHTLYGRPGSGSLVVQVALEEIGAPYERIWVGREPEEIDRFRILNPTGKVPALVLPDGTLMFESAAMLIHLALAAPGANLAPRPGTAQHAQFLQWMVFLSANMYEAALRVYYSARYSSRGEMDADAVREKGASDLASAAELISRSLHPYVLRDAYSIADTYLYMIASWHPEPTQLYARLQPLGAHAALVRARPAVAKVEAEHAMLQ
jgi:glutathione S-transferase